MAARAGRDVSEAELGEMVKALLADRFKLRLRTETLEVPIIELRLARSDGQVGSNLHNCSKERVPETPFRAPTNGTVSVSDCADGGSSLADMASRQLKTFVVDKTGLQGRWDFTLRWTPDETQFANMGVRVPPPSNDPDAPPGLFTAFHEQLGLKLESTKAPVEVLVVDRIEKPSEN